MATQDEKKAKPGIEFYGGYQVYSESGVDLTLLRANSARPVIASTYSSYSVCR